MALVLTIGQDCIALGWWHWHRKALEYHGFLLDSKKDIPSSPPTTAPHYERTSGTVNVPIIMNIWSTQGSMKWTGEMWEGGSTRDELVFNPVYAASKSALSALSMHLAREMRVSTP